MAEDAPSLKGAFDILHQAGQDKLLYLKHKLKAPRPGSKASSFLHTMVLLTLGQETEARIILDSLRGDKVALSVARTWEGTGPLLNQEDLLSCEEQADIRLAVARIYQLLVEEKLCEASSRNQAYQAAIQALSLCHDARLDSILAEAQSQCGQDIHGAESFQMLRSDVSCLPVSSAPACRVSSHPWPIKARSDFLATESLPLSLRSTGSPASFASNLQISQSPTLPFLTHQPQKRSPRGPSKLCEDPPTNSTQDPEPQARQEPEEMSWPCSDPAASLPVQLNSSASVVSDSRVPSSSTPPSPTTPVAPETSTHSPVECFKALSDPTSLQPASVKPAETLVSKDSFRVLPELPPMSVPPAGEGKATPLPVQESDFPKKTTSPRPPISTQDPSPSPWSSLPSGPELDTGQRFFSFVILHAQEDEDIALRVRDTLESLGVPDGTTFCEEFQVPGRFELRCLQDAIDNSAFTVLLLTKHFDCRMSLHQVHVALMNSLTRSEKENSVIPFFPRESTLKSAKVSPLLKGLVSLDESSPVFSKKVSSTFNPRRLQAQREVWKKQQEIRAIQEQTQQMAEDRERVSQKESALSDLAYHYSLLQQQLQNLTLAFPNQASFAQGYRMPMPHPWACSFPPQFTTAPSAFQPNHLIPPMSFPPGPISNPQLDPQGAGAQPLIIHNAHMVQLGLNNYMWGRREGQGPNEEERTEGE
ncbi:TIR domain-containing adapter molecule 1 [Vombatus ursinus]|uniref:TIR domain-containing adapter molecule 1 n=1 Tax=Vombatus ursinus TaxID=29139 RepID=A0A4X2MEU1_VOMUR|nr:TIR domain-containing adapter molecule 1 [Vombatus ursinus]XP_027706782.1 TIR domain-containing adapter molecule 1 [Vombatus ursinus]XP_027706783.1 TIR domain-containing adapter molecule 1 [Vombatus ursinus]XP_027706785.1 TIR domain-containing adapter molecule 1 [Vombatus ursinus]